MLASQKKEIFRVKIVDDNLQARKVLALTLADMNCVPIDEPGPILDLDKFITMSLESADAAICDHRLTTYARFCGAQAVAAFYKQGFPALLCTAFSRADIDIMRPFRPFIPIVLPAGEVNPETIWEGFRICKNELKGDFSNYRKPWRTLLRVVDIDREPNGASVFVVIPSWDSSEVIRLPLSLFPTPLHHKIAKDFRFYAKVNIGTEDQNDLFFNCFEID